MRTLTMAFFSAMVIACAAGCGSNSPASKYETIALIGATGTADTVYKVLSHGPCRFSAYSLYPGKSFQIPIREYPRHARLLAVDWEAARFSAKAILISGEDTDTDFTSNFWPQKKGGETKFQIENGGTTTNYLTARMQEPGILQVHFLSDVAHDLTDVDGLVEGKVRRVIHAGREVRAVLESRELVQLSGPEDTFEVLTNVAKVRLSHGVVQFERGTYSETDLQRTTKR